MESEGSRHVDRIADDGRASTAPHIRTAADAIHRPAARPGPGSTPSIADRFADLLAPLSTRRRRGLIARLSVGYYEGWRPSRAEVSHLVNEELRRSPR